MRAANLYVAVLGVSAWLAFSFGGVGGMMYIGVLVENAFGRGSSYVAWVAWPTFALALIVWWGSLALVAANFRVFFRWASALSDSSGRTAGEWVIRLGHLLVLLACLNALTYRVLDFDFVYGFLLLAGLSYGAGLIHGALTARSTRTATAGLRPRRAAG
jgi:hypothetical protein